MNDSAVPSVRRERSLHLVLDALKVLGPSSRKALGTHTGLSFSAIASIVRILIEAGLVEEETAIDPSRGRGRPSARLSLRREESLVAAIDFGHNHIKVALARGGLVVAEDDLLLDVDRLPVEAMDAAVAAVGSLLTEIGAELSDVAAVAAGVPAPIDKDFNVVAAVNVLPAWIGFNPHDQLVRRLTRPAIVRNDAEMGALGEMRYANVVEKDFLYLKASHGIGACLVLDGRIYRGYRGAAGELGHVQLAGQDNFCRCGKRGCVEAVLGTGRIAQQLSYVLRDQGGMTGEDAASIALAAQFPAGARVLADAGRALGRLLAEVCIILDPAAIIIGGNLGAAGDPLLQGTREAIRRYTGNDAAADVTVRAAALGCRAELLGAVAIATDASASGYIPAL